MAPEVRLREVEPADLPLLFDHQRDPQAVAMADVSPRDVGAFQAHWDALLRDPAVVTRTILADGRVAGHALSFEHDGRRLVGYWLGREHWGRDIASRALVAFLDLLPARPLYASVADHNAASRRVLEKAGSRSAGRRPPASSCDSADPDANIRSCRSRVPPTSGSGGRWRSAVSRSS